MSLFDTVQVVEPSAQVSADCVGTFAMGSAVVLVVADGAGNSRRGASH